MKKQSGIHFYINIANFNKIILEEETKTKNVTHAIHALDTFFTSVESFGKKVSKNLVVEKITGSRLHMYVIDELEPAFQVVKAVSAYSYHLAKYIKKDIPKYKSLLDFYINVGVAYGRFYEFEFTTKEGFSELTTIGYAANYAAKLQALSGLNKISISEDIFEGLPDDEQRKYEKVDETSIEKYGQEKYYTVHLVYVESPVKIEDADLLVAKEYANSDNLKDIDFASVRAPLNFRNLSKTQCKKLDGIPVFADVRGFTSQFKEDDSNLEVMTRKTQEILEAMYRVTIGHGGIHVQFQGDRELSLYHNVPGQTINGAYQEEQKCFRSAVLASMRMIDAVKPYSVHIGVGEDFGTLYATKIGARGEKDNILLGETVIQADKLEDNYAGEDQIAITTDVYSGLKIEDKNLASKFKQVGSYFIATIGYKDYLQSASYNQQSTNTSRNKYNGAWGDLI